MNSMKHCDPSILETRSSVSRAEAARDELCSYRADRALARSPGFVTTGARPHAAAAVTPASTRDKTLRFSAIRAPPARCMAGCREP
jgi:hypothetical protein